MSNNILTMKYPATWWKSAWREGIALGNGRIGALVYGGVYNETIMLTHEDAWWQGKTPELPDISEQLGVVRKLMDDKRYEEAKDLYTKKLKEAGYKPQTAMPLPIGDCIINMKARNAFKNYSRQLNMETGEATVRWQDGETWYTRRTIVSRENNMVICNIQCEGDGVIDGSVALALHNVDDTLTNRGRGALPEGMEILIDGNYISYAIESDDGTHSGAVAKVINSDGFIQDDTDKITVCTATNITVLIKVFTKSEKKSMYKLCKEALANMDASYEAHFAEHAAMHSKLFNGAKLRINDHEDESSVEELLLEAYSGETPSAMVEKMWAFGRYLLISATYDGGMPCALHGLWCGEYYGFWPFNMANENLQMIYWQALSGNMPDLLLSVFSYYEAMMDDFRENAIRLYGCRGIYIPAPTVPGSGKIKSLQHHIIYWTGAAGWIAQHYFDYYAYTNDRAFLRNRALPFMKETALFYEDFLVEDERGYLKSYPAVSPENTPGNFYDGNGMGEAMELTQNPTMDFAIIKELLRNLLHGAKQEEMYLDSIEIWEKMLSKIPPYEINSDGAVKEWLHDDYEDNYHHRHESHLYPVFPGIEVTKENNPELFEAFVVAAKKRLVIGLKEQSAWSLVHMACNYARMEEGDLALECLEIMSRSCVLGNLFTTHNDWRNMGITVDLPWAPFQIDANMGWTAAVQEMLMLSMPAYIKVLPALPSKWVVGSVEGMLCRGNVVIDIKWNQTEHWIDVILRSQENQVIDMIFPHSVLSYSMNDAHTCESGTGNRISNLTIKKGIPCHMRVVLEIVHLSQL